LLEDEEGRRLGQMTGEVELVEKRERTSRFVRIEVSATVAGTLILLSEGSATVIMLPLN
jgi:hypothetical protein